MITVIILDFSTK